MAMVKRSGSKRLIAPANANRQCYATMRILTVAFLQRLGDFCFPEISLFFPKRTKKLASIFALQNFAFGSCQKSMLYSILFRNWYSDRYLNSKFERRPCLVLPEKSVHSIFRPAKADQPEHSQFGTIL